MQIGYMRVSKADGSQSIDLQRDAPRAATCATSSTSFTTSARADWPRCVYRHHHAGWQPGVRYLRGASGIRARPDLRANESWPWVGSRPRTKKRCALQDDCGESAPCHGYHGAKGNESSRLVQRIEYYPANALPACRAGRQATEGRAESHRSRTDTASARKETVNAMAYPGFPFNCYSDP
jgi:hypothetical protein